MRRKYSRSPNPVLIQKGLHLQLLRLLQKWRQIFLIQLDSQKNKTWIYIFGYPKRPPPRFHLCWLEKLGIHRSSKSCLSASRTLLRKPAHCCLQPFSLDYLPTNSVLLPRQFQSRGTVVYFLKVNSVHWKVFSYNWHRKHKGKRNARSVRPHNGFAQREGTTNSQSWWTPVHILTEIIWIDIFWKEETE